MSATPANQAALTPEAASEISGYFGIITDIFLRLIKMTIAPLVFATLVSGLANIGDSKIVGRIGTKALHWLRRRLPGVAADRPGLRQPAAAGPCPEHAAAGARRCHQPKTGVLNSRGLQHQSSPRASSKRWLATLVLQILVFSVFFGWPSVTLHSQVARSLVQTMDEVVHVMLKVTDYVMRFCPAGVFAAVAAVVTTQGSALAVFGKLLASFYPGALLRAVGGAHRGWLRGAGQGRVPSIAGAQPHAARLLHRQQRVGLPQAGMEQLEKLACRTGSPAVPPLGYPSTWTARCSTPASLPQPVAQSTGIPCRPLGEQVTMLLVLMISEQGRGRRNSRSSFFGGGGGRAAHVPSAGGRSAADHGHRPLPGHGPHRHQRARQRDCHLLGRGQVGNAIDPVDPTLDDVGRSAAACC